MKKSLIVARTILAVGAVLLGHALAQTPATQTPPAKKDIIGNETTMNGVKIIYLFTEHGNLYDAIMIRVK